MGDGMTRKLYDHHIKPVGDVHHSKAQNVNEVVAVSTYTVNALFPNSKVPVEVFDDWKKVRGLMEETDLGQLDMWDLGP